MMRPSSHASKLLFILLFSICIYFILMDTFLFLRIKRYNLDIFQAKHENESSQFSTSKSIQKLANYEDFTWMPCSFNPLCHPTVKALMIDPVNHYVYAPLCTLFDLGLGISDHMTFVTPNMISFSHVFLSAVAGKLLTSSSLTDRRLAVLLFQIKMFLDDLDGHVARERMHQKGERSEVGTLGYWVDGIADIVGGAFMVLGVFCYLISNPLRRGYKGAKDNVPYLKLNQINSLQDLEKDNSNEVGISYKTKVSIRKIVLASLLISGQLLLSSLAWNRYIDLYQNLLEGPSNYDLRRREDIFRSTMFFYTSGVWRLVNPHSFFHLLCIAVYCDKTWGFLSVVHHTGYVFVLLAMAVTEFRLSADTVFVVSGASNL